MKTYKIGDIVFLKSGGPAMTISDDAGDNLTSIVTCVYYNQVSGEMVRGMFHEDQLRSNSTQPQTPHIPQATRG